MKKKGNFRKVVSGLLAGMTMLSTVLSPMTAYAAEIQPEEKPPLYEEVKDLLDEDEVVTAKDYEIETGSVFDVKSDYTGLEIKDADKVKVTFEEAKNDKDEDFTTDHADTYKAVYYVEPVNQEHPKYQISRKLIVREKETEVQTETEGSEAVTESETAGSEQQTEKAEDSEADSEITDIDADEFDDLVEQAQNQDTYDEESGLELHDVLEQAGDEGVDLDSMEEGEIATFEAVSAYSARSKTFHITRPDESIRPALIDKINNLTKPKGSLGILEELALQTGPIQPTLSPTLKHPQNIIFAADHGIVEEGVSLSPKEITWQQISNFLHGGAGVNFLCRQHGFTLKIVDAGVDYDLPYEKGIINMKVRKSTRSYLHEAAMTEEEMEMCLERGAEVVRQCHEEGSNVLSFGEMGIGNTSSSSLWMTCFTGIPLEQCVGAGSGLDSAGIRHKYEVLKQSMENYKGDGSPRDIIRYFGGLEMVMAIGAMLQAAELKMIILVDGFIMTNCLLAAARLYPEVTAYAIFGHRGDESGHKLVLDALHARPLLNLGLRLGEGTGAICAYPIVDSAVRMLNEMDNFAHASITKYF